MSKPEEPGRTPMPAAFLDRDGVLNIDKGYVHRPEDLEWVRGAPEAVRLLNEAGYRVIVITNQSGVARGLYDERAVRRFHAHMQAQLGKRGAHIDAFYYCPHHPEGCVPKFSVVCNCRKPMTGLLDQAIRDFAINMERSFLIGDKEQDVEAARAFGIRGFAFDSVTQPLNDFVKHVLASRRRL